jgi:tRNA(adenine34) deaminase
MSTPRVSTPRLHREKFMKEALIEAGNAKKNGDVPVGSVAVLNNKIIGRGYNRKELLNDPTAHAEIMALKNAGENLGSWNLSGVELYVTLEPCTMCAGAIVNSRIDTLIFGAVEHKTGGVISKYAICSDPRLNHQVKIVKGILEKECSQILRSFFQEIRENKQV